MPPSDNESSDDETDAFTTTDVLLGYASKEPTDDSFSQLGGYPVCLHFTKNTYIYMKISTHHKSTDMARTARSPICKIGKMQNLPQNDGFDPAAERRSSRAVPHPRSAALHIYVQVQNLSEEGR